MTSRLRQLAFAALAIYAAASTLMARQTGPLEGLWAYETIATPGNSAVLIAGLFVFRDGRFVQQSLNVGEPAEKQIAQGHAGTYEVSGSEVRMTAQVGFVIDPTRQTPVESRKDSEHHLTFERSGDRLTLTFGTGTIQKFKQVGPAEGQVYPLNRGALALVDGHFLLVADTGSPSVAGSGTFQRAGDSLRLRPDRWFSIRDGHATYSHTVVNATFDGKALKVPEQPALMVIK